jgi:6-phosphogluconolactonase
MIEREAPMGELIIVPDADHMARTAAERFTALATKAMERRGRFVVALSGGSTPRPLYAQLAREPFATQIDWTSVHVFWGDERCVPPYHTDSNYRMARKALLDHVAIPSANIHRIKGELPPEEAAAAYQDVLRAFGRFDLILLGMGADGHTASLFPGTTAIEHREHAAVAVHVTRLDAWRVTLTLPTINRARHVLFLVSGGSKAEALGRVHAGATLPAGRVQPTDGDLTWIVDQNAAAQIPQNS